LLDTEQKDSYSRQLIEQQVTMAKPDMEVIKEIPGYKVILKAVLKSQIQQLVSFKMVLYTQFDDQYLVMIPIKIYYVPPLPPISSRKFPNQGKNQQNPCPLVIMSEI
jgi:hypothetical protein